MTASSIQLKKLWWAGPLTVLMAIVGVLIVRAIAMAILPAPYAPGLAMLMLPIILTLDSLYRRGSGVCAGGTFCKESDTNLSHYFVHLSGDQLFT